MSISDINLDLSLVYQERVGNILFLIGTILAIISTYQAEESILSKLSKSKPKSDKSGYSIAMASWLFLISSIVFAHVAIIRLIELTQSRGSDISPIVLKGSKIAVMGDIFKVIGFGLAAIGNQLKTVDSNQVTTISQ